MGKLLYYGLAKEIQSLAFKNTNKKKIKRLQNQLRTQASLHGLASLSSLQIGDANQMLVILKQEFLRPDRWKDYKKVKQASYDCFCNPEICDVSEQSCLQWEQCGSYPGIRMLINRPISIIWKYMTQSFKDIGPQQAKGFKARIIQHQIDHMVGFDFILKAQQISIKNPSLHQQCDEKLQNLFKQFKNNKILASPEYLRLKQMIVYSIIDSEKK